MKPEKSPTVPVLLHISQFDFCNRAVDVYRDKIRDFLRFHPVQNQLQCVMASYSERSKI